MITNLNHVAIKILQDAYDQNKKICTCFHSYSDDDKKAIDQIKDELETLNDIKFIRILNRSTGRTEFVIEQDGLDYLNSMQ